MKLELFLTWAALITEWIRESSGEGYSASALYSYSRCSLSACKMTKKLSSIPKHVDVYNNVNGCRCLQKRPSYSGNLSSETPRDSDFAFPHWEDVLVA